MRYCRQRNTNSNQKKNEGYHFAKSAHFFQLSMILKNDKEFYLILAYTQHLAVSAKKF